jgi:hypothetical protein
MTINDLTKRIVRRRAENQCEYCHLGRATCDRLDMNDDRYLGERSIIEARSLWVEAGWHPPSEDPRQIDER